jgi:hypothetical protein
MKLTERKMQTTDLTFNLTALADRLFEEKRLLPLAGKIRRARDVCSLVVDLMMAAESLDALETLLANPTEVYDFNALTAQSALLNYALVLYARATKTDSDERGGFDLRSRFNDQEKLTHQELSDLRDQAIAHFGSGGSYTGVWQAELVVLQSTGNGEKVGVVTRRQTTDFKLAARARKQIGVAYDLLCALRTEKLNEVTIALTEAAKEDPTFGSEVKQHPLNLDAFLSSVDAAHAARSAVDVGYAKGSVKHRG